MKALANARVLLPEGLRDDIVVVIDGGRIRALPSEVPVDAETIDCGGDLLLPGFIDTQVNGGGGALFNDAPTLATVETMAAAHRRFGTTGLLPTLISDDLDVIAAAIAATDAAIEAGVPGIIGRHIEGPFLSLERRGIHDAARIRAIDRDAITLLTSARHGRTLVTLAPECVAHGDIASLVAGGAIVAAGHSQADYDTVRRAIAEGMTGVTHLFNAMPPMMNRAPGLVGAALDSPELTAGIIVDGQHLHPATVRLALAAKGRDRLMLVTDAMPTTGSGIVTFSIQGRVIRREGDRLIDGNDTLAGSTLDMATAVRLTMAQTGASFADVSTMASVTPAAFLGIAGEVGAIRAGLRGDLVLVDEPTCDVKRVWIGGTEHPCA